MQIETNKIIHGDSLEKLKELQDNSIDSIVTDPPYELGFMGKSWDSTGIANNVELWRECLRVLKPGGHLLAFSGTRTYHRMACAIEDAGFEVRDMIEWVYGSGFPKSTNIAKQIDKRGGKSVSWFGKWLREWREKENIPQKEISKLFPSKTGRLTGCVANWELGLNMPTNEQFNLICKTFNLPFENLQEAERELITIKDSLALPINDQLKGWGEKREYKITKGTSEWEGWGTALKPAHEPICMARKPLAEKTVAENCLKWGTGGINIETSRVTSNSPALQNNQDYENVGRFPSNLLHDNSEEVRECFPDTGGAVKNFTNNGANQPINLGGGMLKPTEGSSGNASRFFKSIIYQAKASKSERDRGCEEFPISRPDTRTSTGMGSFEQKGVLPGRNNHPTVKPIALMEYLIKMVTKEGGTVLDPFAGSGTTLVAAKQSGYNYVGIELTEEYIPIIEARLSAVKENPKTLF